MHSMEIPVPGSISCPKASAPDVSGCTVPPRWSNRQGFVHIYCGNGKGKTTAALGLSLRTLLTGGSVYFAQFFKGSRTAEEQLCTLCDRFVIDQLGTGRFISGQPQEAEIRAARRGLEFCRDVLTSGYFNLVVLDEILYLLSYRMISDNEVIDLLTMRHPGVEVVLTGRRAPATLIRLADLVTDMSSVKHYFDQGIGARSGIEY